jgi:hypothetical protein
MDNKHEFELDNTEQMELILDKRKDPEKPFAPRSTVWQGRVAGFSTLAELFQRDRGGRGLGA